MFFSISPEKTYPEKHIILSEIPNKAIGNCWFAAAVVSLLAVFTTVRNPRNCFRFILRDGSVMGFVHRECGGGRHESKPSATRAPPTTLGRTDRLKGALAGGRGVLSVDACTRSVNTPDPQNTPEPDRTCRLLRSNDASVNQAENRRFYAKSF